MGKGPQHLILSGSPNLNHYSVRFHVINAVNSLDVRGPASESEDVFFSILQHNCNAPSLFAYHVLIAAGDEEDEAVAFARFKAEKALLKAADNGWLIGDKVDIETEDSIECGAMIIGATQALCWATSQTHS